MQSSGYYYYCADLLITPPHFKIISLTFRLPIKAIYKDCFVSSFFSRLNVVFGAKVLKTLNMETVFYKLSTILWIRKLFHNLLSLSSILGRLLPRITRFWIMSKMCWLID